MFFFLGFFFLPTRPYPPLPALLSCKALQFGDESQMQQRRQQLRQRETPLSQNLRAAIKENSRLSCSAERERRRTLKGPLRGFAALGVIHRGQHIHAMRANYIKYINLVLREFLILLISASKSSAFKCKHCKNAAEREEDTEQLCPKINRCLIYEMHVICMSNKASQPNSAA